MNPMQLSASLAKEEEEEAKEKKQRKKEQEKNRTKGTKEALDHRFRI